MSSFTTALQTEYDDDGLFTLLIAFVYELGGLGTGIPIVVPAGFKTDFASIPKLLRWILDPTDPDFGKASVLHDWLYRQAVHRALADAIFLEAMGVLRCPSWKKWLVYCSVRIGGYWTWRRYADKKVKIEYDVQKAFEDGKVGDFELAA